MERRIYERHPIGNKRFQWKQRDFVLSTFAGVPMHGSGEGEISEVCDRYVRYLKEAGFNMIETGWVTHDYVWAAVDACERHGLDLVFQDMTIMGGMQHYHLDNHVPEETVRKLVEKLREKKRVVGYYVWDEPHNDAQFTEARRQMDLLQKYDPDALLFTVAVPDYNGCGAEKKGYNWENGLYAPYVERFIQRMDPPVLSFDYYPIGDYFHVWGGHQFNREKQLDDTYMWLDLGLHRKLSAEHQLPLWFYYQGYTLYNCTDYFIFPMVRCFMYAAMLHGAKGLQHYAAGGKDNLLLTASGEPYGFYEDFKRIHSEIAALGNTLMALESRLVYHSAELLPGDQFMKSYADTIADSAIFAGELPNRVSIGELEDEAGNRYALILNRDYEKPLCASLDLQGTFRVYEVSKADGRQRIRHEATAQLPVELAPGDAVLMRMQPAQEEAFDIEYRLTE